MSIQVSMVQNHLYVQMALVLFLLQPYFTSIRMWVVRRYNYTINSTILKHIYIGCYAMIGIMLVDSTYKWNKSDTQLLTYRNEKNFYLCIFSLFLAVVIKKLCALLETSNKSDRLNKQTIKQNSNSRDFINSVIEDSSSEKKRLEKEIERLLGELSKKENIEKDVQRTQDETKTFKKGNKNTYSFIDGIKDD